MFKYTFGLETILQGGPSEPEPDGDLVCKFRNIFSENCKTISFSTVILRQTARIVVNQITADNFASLFNCTTVSRSSD